MTEDYNKDVCTTRHNCPGVEKILGHKPKFLGFVPTTSGFDRKGYKLLFFVWTKNRKFLLWANTKEEAAQTIAANE